MSPAFSSSRQAAAFALLLLAILLSPLFVGKGMLPTREQMYAAVGRETIDFPNFHHEIFEETGDIDIAIMGSSRLGCAIDSTYLQDQLSAKLGRAAVVRSLTWTWNGYDALYFLARDLLQHRKVHTMVISDLSYDLSPGVGDIAHHQTSYWFRFADDADALGGLPMRSKASFYASAVLGLPRNLVGLLRSNLPVIPLEKNAVAWNTSSTEFTPEPGANSAQIEIYSESGKGDFHFSDRPASQMQLAFLRKMGALAHEYQTQLVFLNLPDLADRKQAQIEETTDWPHQIDAHLPLIGIPPATLFAGLSDDDIRKLYYNPTHFNQNGERYFTRLVTPSLIQTYEDQVKP